MPNVNLQSPWETIRGKVYNFFAKDPDINVQDRCTDVGEGKYSFYIESQDSERLANLEKIMKKSYDLGNITLEIEFKYANGVPDLLVDPDDVNTWKKAFGCNPYFVEVVTERDPAGRDWNYAVFSRDVISFFNDDLSDYCANAHFIPAEIVREFVEEGHIYCCTKAPEADPVDPGAVN